LREAIKAEPDNRDARLELGRALFETGDIQGAIHETEALLQMDPANVDALYNLGAIYGNMAQDERAREYWQKAANTAPDSESGRRAKENLPKLN
jgi:tetratricopeptide (TPR) repeat protein